MKTVKASLGFAIILGLALAMGACSQVCSVLPSGFPGCVASPTPTPSPSAMMHGTVDFGVWMNQHPESITATMDAGSANGFVVWTPESGDYVAL